MARLAAGETVLLDGGTGTECERRGVPRLEPAWSGGAALSHPDIVRQVHADYLDAGAEVIIANTFATHRHVLEQAGVADDFEAYNRDAVRLAVEARREAVARGVPGADRVVVAGGISNWTWVGEHPPLGVLRANATDQARIMVEAGAEVLILEMMIDIERMLATLDGATAAGLPIWVGFTTGVFADGPLAPLAADGGTRLRDGELLADALAALDGRGIDVVAIMHTEVELVDGSLDVVLDRSRWPGVVGVYAHSGRTLGSTWTHDDAISPADYAAASRRWLDRGVRVIGSCCGTRPDHIEALAALLAP